MQISKYFLPLFALAAACGEQPAQPVQDTPAYSAHAAGGVEHWTVQKEGHTVTFYPGFASRAVLQSAGGTVEMYRQSGSYRLPAGAEGAARQHQIVLRGGQYGRDVALSVFDPKHEIARIRLFLYGAGHVPGSGIQSEPVDTLVVDNTADFCPPICNGMTGSGAASSVSTSYVDAAASFVAPSFAPRVSRAGGYELSVDPSFASRAVAEVRGGGAVELYRQNEIFNLPAGFTVPATAHQIRLSGGKFGRNLALQVSDPKHHVANIEISFHDPSRKRGDAGPNEKLTVLNTADTCPPHCDD